MSRTPTTRLALSKPDPGSGEPYDASVDLGTNWDKVDGAAGFTVVTSSTRPTGSDAWDGRPIAETDTGLFYVRRSTNWRQLLADAGSGFVTNDQLIDIRRTGTAAALRSRNTGDTNPRFEVDSNGKTSWGAGGASALDTNLYRSAADTLKTDDALVVGAALTVTGAAPWYMAESLRDSSSPTFTTTETVVDSVTFTGVAQDRYLMLWAGHFQSSVANDLCQIRFRWQSGGSLTTSGTQFLSVTPNCDIANRAMAIGLMRSVVPGVAGTVSMGVTAVRNTGSGTIAMNGSSTQNAILTVVRVR
jgi:hypothetical protein